MRYPTRKPTEKTVHTSIFHPQNVSSISKGRKINIPRTIEIHIICINIKNFLNHNS